jgi:hypothetical protein
MYYSFQEKNGQFVLYIEFRIPIVEFDMGRQPKPKPLGGLSVASDQIILFWTLKILMIVNYRRWCPPIELLVVV